MGRELRSTVVDNCLTTHIQKSEKFYSRRNFGSLLVFFEKYVFCEIH